MPEVARGHARTFGLASLLHLVEGEGITGRLTFGAGTVELHNGFPVDAAVRRLTGRAALLELFVQPADTFVVETADVPARRPLGDIGMLVLEGCRLQDEWARLATLTLAPAPGATLPPALAPLAPFLDGARPVALALDAARMDRAAAIDPLLHALEAGQLVEVAARVPATPFMNPDEVYEVVMDAARRAVRAGDLETAHTHFLAALGARPDDRIAQQNLRRIAALRKSA